MLTTLLQNYNGYGKYVSLFEKAKNANFDCACGYDANVRVDACFDHLNLEDCIYLAKELNYLDALELLVTEWKSGVVEWTNSKRRNLIRFNNFLGKNNDNIIHYKELLNAAIVEGKCFNIASAYSDIIKLYITEQQFELGYSYLKEMIDNVDFKEILKFHLFSFVLEECFEIICGMEKAPMDLWVWAKKYLIKMGKQRMFGNLYEKSIAAAKCCGDSIANQLEKEYIAWKKEMGLK